ncbi:MAG: M20/M25/M40 family metallo-hydrolase [Gallintestinimicrobium sp.]
MHACGHDFHITAGIGTAIWLQEHKDELCGTVRFFFQPGEESSWAHGKCWKRRHSIRLRASGAFILIRLIWSMPSASGRAQLRRQ